MSTAATVRAAWAASVWAHASITAITTKIYNFDIQELADVSTAHEAKLLYNQRINFFQYRVTKEREYNASYNAVLYRYPVLIRYFREAEDDFDGDEFNAVEDAFETLFTVVRSELGDTWGGTVEFYRWQSGPPSLALATIGERRVWVGEYSLTGEQSTTLL